VARSYVQEKYVFESGVLKKAVETAVDDKIMNVHGLQKWFAIKSQRTTKITCPACAYLGSEMNGCETCSM